MVGVSDIPDWCHVEAGGLGSYDFDKFYQGGPDIDSMKRIYIDISRPPGSIRIHPGYNR